MFIIVIYRNPLDFPDKWVARVFENDRPKHHYCVADKYKDVLDWGLQELREKGNYAPTRMPRQANDEPQIFEVWF